MLERLISPVGDGISPSCGTYLPGSFTSSNGRVEMEHGDEPNATEESVRFLVSGNMMV